jgi:two-component system C4-dicarboxylate transport response regulator DctD
MKTVLVVDDEYLIRWSLREGLKSGFNVLTAGTVDEALAILRSAPVDAVVTDLRMPGRDGLELVELLRSVAPAVKVFVITAFGSDPVIDRLFALDVEGFIRKPFEVQLVRDMLATHLADEGRDQRSEMRGRTA